MGKQKYTAKEKKVSRMTRNGLVEENLATKETRKVTNSDQELPYKQKDVEQAFITSEKKKNSHKKAEKKQSIFSKMFGKSKDRDEKRKKEIEDEKFHELREQYLKAAKKLRDYIGTKVDLEEY